MKGKVYPTLQLAFLDLLRSGLWGDEPDCHAFPLSEEAWESLYSLACRQTVEGVVYDGICRLPVHLLPPARLLIRWTAVVDEMERCNKKMNATLDKLNRWMKENDVQAWLMKGQGTALCYPQPLHRRCGDIDLYFPDAADAAKMLRLVEAEKLPVEHLPGWSVVYTVDRLSIDQHSRLVDIHNPWVGRYLKKLIQAETGHTVAWKAGVGNIVLPSPLLAHLISVAHILKHLMAVGVGFRQLCDVAQIYKHYNDHIQGRQLAQIYKQLGIYRWVQTLHHVLVKELEMPPAYLPFPLTVMGEVSWMKDVWEGGNFGFYDQRLGAPSATKKRNRVAIQLFHHLLPQVRYAPAEAFWFPLIQLYSRYCRK